MCHVRLRLSKDFRRYGHRSYPVWEHRATWELHPGGVTSCRQQDPPWMQWSLREIFYPQWNWTPPARHCSALDPCPPFFGLCTVPKKKKKKVTRKGEKQNRKTVSKSRNRSLSNHYGNGEVTIPGKPGMKQPHTPRTERCIFNVICNKGRW